MSVSGLVFGAGGTIVLAMPVSGSFLPLLLWVAGECRLDSRLGVAAGFTWGVLMYLDFSGDKLGLLLFASDVVLLDALIFPIEGNRCREGFLSNKEDNNQLLLLPTMVRPVVDWWW